MSLPYERATSGRRALDDVEKILGKFGATRFGVMTDTEKREVIVQFTYRNRDIIVCASVAGYAAALLKKSPAYRGSLRSTAVAKYEQKALHQAEISVYSVLRDWIKGQVTAIEVGALSFEGAFLGQIMLPSGKTVLDTIEAQKLLPPSEPDQKLRIAK
jgi:hypothetical protein